MFPSLWRFLNIYQSMILLALLYSTAAFVIGWVAGGPDMIDGQRVLVTDRYPTEIPTWLRGTITILAFVAILVILYVFSPKPDAWLTRLAQRRGLVVTLLALLGVAIALIAAPYLF